MTPTAETREHSQAVVPGRSLLVHTPALELVEALHDELERCSIELRDLVDDRELAAFLAEPSDSRTAGIFVATLPGGADLLCEHLRRLGAGVCFTIISVVASGEIEVTVLSTPAERGPAQARLLARRVERAIGLTHPVLDRRRYLVSNDGRIVADSSRDLLLRDGERVALSYSEWEILACLGEQPLRIWSREQLLGRTSRGGCEATSLRTIDAHVKNLRRKIEDDPSSPVYIRTARRRGYHLEGFGGDPGRNPGGSSRSADRRTRAPRRRRRVASR